MKGWRNVLLGLIGLCVILGGMCCYAGADVNLPDGFQLLKQKMEKKELPFVDLKRFKFDIPDNIPDEIAKLKGYLWCGRFYHIFRGPGTGLVESYLFLLKYHRETGEMEFVRFWGTGWQTLKGKIAAEEKGRIELHTSTGSLFILLLRSKDHVVVRAYDGFEADMKKIGTILPPSQEFPPFPAEAMSQINTINLPRSLQRLANKTWEGSWYNSEAKKRGAGLRIRLAGYDEKQKLVKLYYAWIYGHPYPSGIREMYGTFEEEKNLTVEDMHQKTKFTLQIDGNPENDHIHAIRHLPEPLGYEADFLPLP